MRFPFTGVGVAVVACVALPVGGSTSATDGGSRKAALEFVVLTTGNVFDSSVVGDGATHDAGMLTQHLEAGQAEQTMYMYVRLGQGSPSSPCGSNVMMTMAPQDLAGFDAPLLAWTVSGSVSHVATDRIGGRYTWQRQKRGPDGASHTTTGEGQVALREDDRVLLDFVRLEPSDSSCYRNLALELRAKVAEDDRPRDRLAYDLWLEGDAPGRRVTRHLRLSALEGEKVAFDYGKLWATAGASPSDPSHTTVSGQLRGRIEPDGTVDLAFFAQRQVFGGHWAVSAHGEKRVQAVLGETLRLDLPPPGQAASLKPAELDVIRGQRLSLTLTVARLD